MRVLQNTAVGGISVRTRFINRNGVPASSGGSSGNAYNDIYTLTLVDGVNATDTIIVPIPDGATYADFKLSSNFTNKPYVRDVTNGTVISLDGTPEYNIITQATNSDQRCSYIENVVKNGTNLEITVKGLFGTNIFDTMDFIQYNFAAPGGTTSIETIDTALYLRVLNLGSPRPIYLPYEKTFIPGRTYNVRTNSYVTVEDGSGIKWKLQFDLYGTIELTSIAAGTWGYVFRLNDSSEPADTAHTYDVDGSDTGPTQVNSAYVDANFTTDFSLSAYPTLANVTFREYVTDTSVSNVLNITFNQPS